MEGAGGSTEGPFSVAGALIASVSSSLTAYSSTVRPSWAQICWRRRVGVAPDCRFELLREGLEETYKALDRYEGLEMTQLDFGEP